MSIFTKMADKVATAAVFLAVPVMCAALWQMGERGVDGVHLWQLQRHRKVVIDSIVASTTSRVVLGDPRAKTTFIEVMDYECPACRATDSVLTAGLGQSAATRIIAIHYPLTSIHPLAQRAAIASVCAERQNSGRAFHHALYSQRVPKQPSAMWQLAQKSGVSDSASFLACLSSPAAAAAVRREASLSAEIGVAGTPTFFAVDGREVSVNTVLNGRDASSY